MKSESYFDGGILDYSGYSILVAIIFGITLGSQHIGRFAWWKIENQTHGSGWATSILWRDWNTTIRQLDQGVSSNHHHVWDLWPLIENKNEAMDCRTHQSYLKIKTASSFRGDIVFLFRIRIQKFLPFSIF